MTTTQILDLLEGAENLVKGWAQVQKGERVLILTDRTGFADPLVVDALAVVCHNAGAEVTTITCPGFEYRLGDPPAVVTNAIYACNHLFSILPAEAPIHSRACRVAMLEYGVKLAGIVANTAELMSSEWARFPPELYWAIMKKSYDFVKGGKVIKVTSENGTNCVSRVPDALGFLGVPIDDTGNPGPPPPGSGEFNMFPFGVLGVIPINPANGTLVYDALLGLRGLLKEKVELTVENTFITRIEGGWEAGWFHNLIDRTKAKGVQWVDIWAETMWGLNPKASVQRGLNYIHIREAEMTRHAGVLHFGIGRGGQGFHWDGIVIKPTVLIDDVPLIQDGRLLVLDDPEIIALAREFGDPKELLADTP
ncbi:MAG: hypothetical protein HY673_18455 [Chloroflexi bacterium]|nr:hypothetical protein [Chloroflexota bacterium]